MIELWDNWVIDADEYQFILGKAPKKERKGPKDPTMISMSFHSSIGKALLSLYKAELRESIKNNAHTIMSVKEAAEAIEKRIMSLFKEPDFGTAIEDLLKTRREI